MTRLTTTTMTVSPRSIGPWGDRLWRVSLQAGLVEGGERAYWVVTPTQPAQFLVKPNEVELELPDEEFVLESVLMLLATHLGDEHVEGYLLDTGNIVVLDGVRTIAPYWDISAPETKGFLARKLSSSLRLGLTMLEQDSLIGDSVVRRLREMGFDLDVFGLMSTSESLTNGGSE